MKKTTKCPECGKGNMISYGGSVPECGYCGHHQYDNGPRVTGNEKRYTLVNRNGAKIEFVLVNGIVCGVYGGSTGKPLAHFLANGCTVLE